MGNGLLINTWEEAWIGVKNPSRPMRMVDNRSQAKKVGDLIEERATSWRMDIINKNFSKDAKQIASIPLSHRKPPDRCIWRPAKNHFFSVKTAYHLAVSTSSQLPPRRDSSSHQPKEWLKLWNINVIPRVKNFCWRACLQSLPTRDNLMRRGFIDDPICVLCDEETESIDHLLLRCPVVAKTWYLSPLRINTRRAPFITFKELLWNHLNEANHEALN